MEKLIIAIEAEQDVVIVREEASELAKQMGFDELACAQIALGVSEIVQNVIRYADSGIANIYSRMKNRVLCVEIIDNGKGFKNINQAKQEGFSSSNSSLGLGLSVAERAFDQMTINSMPNTGTTIVLEKYLPFPGDIVRYGSVSIKDERYLVNGDALFIKEFDGDNILLAVIDGVGQGKLAHDVSNIILTILKNQYRLALDELINLSDRALHKSELEGGATIALALIHSKSMFYIGIGDTHSYLQNSKGEVTLLENQDGRLGEFQLPKLQVREYKLSGLTNIILCTDGINTHIPEELPGAGSDPQHLAIYIFNHYHRLYGDATALIAQYQAGLL